MERIKKIMDDNDRRMMLLRDKRFKKRSMWNWSSEQLLLAVWAERRSDLKRAKQNSYIIKEMTEELHRHNYRFTFTAVKDKMHNMTKRYRKEKANVQKGGDSLWPYYHQMDQLLGSDNPRKKRNDAVSKNEEHFEEADCTMLPPMFGEMPPNTSPLLMPLMKQSPASESYSSHNQPLNFENTQRHTEFENSYYQNEILRRFDDISEEIRKTNVEFSKISNQILQIEQQKVMALSKYVSDSAETNKAFVKYLKSKTEAAE